MSDPPRYTTDLSRPAARVLRHGVLWDGAPLSFREALELLRDSTSFRGFFTDLLRNSPGVAWKWETPSISTDTAERPFELVLVQAPHLERRPDPRPFGGYFDGRGQGIVHFPSLGGDAHLIVPSPRADHAVYTHLAAFLRGAPEEQIHALWETAGAVTLERLSNDPIWLSTAGGGVAWLHLRLDSRPKYYGYAPFKER